MFLRKKTSFKKPYIIIPTYNEKDNIKQLILDIINWKLGFNIVIVDDNSPDGTGYIADDLSKRHKKVKVIHRDKKKGLGTAYIEGFKFAIKEGADCVFEMDADYSHDPKVLPKFLEALENYDLVIGSRYLNGISVVNWPLRRLLLSLMASWYVKLILGLPIKDCTSGFKCFKRQVLENMDLSKINSNGYAFQIEMNYLVYKRGFKVGEIPIIFVDRHAGTTKMSKQIVWEAIRIVWKLRFKKTS